MTLQEIYELAVDMGVKADPRGIDGVKKFLGRAKKEYQELSAKKKQFFDKESLTNPYSDSRILYGDPKLSVKKIMAGIDADASEVLLADRLNHPTTGSGFKIDLLISHHPSGHALASLHEVMDIQVDVFEEANVPANVAHALLDDRKQVVKRKIDPINHSKAIDAARLLGVPLLAIHTIWDNLGHKLMNDYINKKKFDTVAEVLEYVNEIPEFIESTKGKAGPSLVSGSEKSRVGKIAVLLTGGTNPSKELYVEMAKAGVGTIIDMHMPEDAVQELRKHHVNVVNTGHMAADSIGANLFLDEIEKKGVKVIPCSGLIRVRRNK